MNSREYEIFVGRLLERLASIDLVEPSSVTHLKKFTGKSGETYEIDISYSFQVAGSNYLTLVECKCWNRAVGRDVVSALRSTVEDIGAHKGVVVSTVGFQKGAIGLAMKSGIALFKVSDIENPRLHAFANLTGPGNDILRYITEYTREFSGGKFVEETGLCTVTAGVFPFLARRHGPEVARFIRENHESESDEIDFGKIEDEEARNALVSGLASMNEEWIYDYLEVESCGLPLHVEPHLQLRILNLRVFGLIKDARDHLTGKQSWL